MSPRSTVALWILVAVVVAVGLWLLRRNWETMKRVVWQAWAAGRFPRFVDKLVGFPFEHSDSLAGLQEQIVVLVLRDSRRTRGGTVLLPTSIVVGCHPHDYYTLTDGAPDIQGELNRELRSYLPQAADVHLVLRELLTAEQGTVKRLSVDFSAATVDLNVKEKEAPVTKVMQPRASLKIGSRRVDLVADSYTLGRASDSDIRLSSQMISKHHAQLYLRDGRWYVRDTRSSNGTRVNRTKIIAPVRLSDGDTITFADTETTFHNENPPN